MAGVISADNRSLRADGIDSSTAETAVLAALSTAPGLTVRQLGNGRIRATRTFRPRWAVAVAVLTAPLVGLGLLFLLVRRVETGEIVIVDGPRGSVITLAGQLPDGLAESIRTIIETGSSLPRADLPVDLPIDTTPVSSPPIMVADVPPVAASQLVGPPNAPTSDDRFAPTRAAPAPAPLGSAAAAASAISAPVSLRDLPPPGGPAPGGPVMPPPPSAGVGVGGDDLDGRTIARPAVPAAPTSVTLHVEGLPATSLVAGTRMLVGRDPAALSGDSVLRVPDGSLGVSKTHLAIEFDGQCLIVEDLNSTNGTRVGEADNTTLLTAGARHPVSLPTSVVLGELRIDATHP